MRESSTIEYKIPHNKKQRKVNIFVSMFVGNKITIDNNLLQSY